MTAQEEIFTSPTRRTPGSYLPKTSKHVGTIGERIEIEATVERVTSFNRRRFGSDWQTERVYIVTMRDDAGNAIVSRSTRFSPQQGTRLVIRCTIKWHTEWNEERQTVVFRIKGRERS